MAADETHDHLLFQYYAEQGRHTERLRLEFTKFFAGLVSAIAVAGGYLLQIGGGEQQVLVLRVVGGAGCAICVIAALTISLYQYYIEQWVDAKNELEKRFLEADAGVDFSNIDSVRRRAIEEPRRAMRFVVLPFVLMSIAFLWLALFPGVLGSVA